MNKNIEPRKPRSQMQISRHDMPNKPNSSNLAAEFRFSDLSLISPEAPPPTPPAQRRAPQPWEAVLPGGTRLLQVVADIYRNSNAARGPSTFSIHNHRNKSKGPSCSPAHPTSGGPHSGDVAVIVLDKELRYQHLSPPQQYCSGIPTASTPKCLISRWK